MNKTSKLKSIMRESVSCTEPARKGGQRSVRQRDKVFVEQGISDIVRRGRVGASASGILVGSIVFLVEGKWEVDLAGMVFKELLEQWMLKSRVLLKVVEIGEDDWGCA